MPFMSWAAALMAASWVSACTIATGREINSPFGNKKSLVIFQAGGLNSALAIGLCRRCFRLHKMFVQRFADDIGHTHPDTRPSALPCLFDYPLVKATRNASVNGCAQCLRGHERFVTHSRTRCQAFKCKIFKNFYFLGNLGRLSRRNIKLTSAHNVLQS